MKQFQGENFTSKEDIQIQIPTCRLYVIIAVAQGTLDQTFMRARLVTGSGTVAVLERTSIKRLFEIGSNGAGFYRIGYPINGVEYYSGHIDIAKGGALDLSNSRYLSADITSPNQIAFCQVFAISHPKLTDTYLYYNPVSITQSVQAIELNKAVDVVLPIDYVKLARFSYLGLTGTVEHTKEELRAVADMSNDIAYVQSTSADGLQTKAVYGHDGLIMFPTTDGVSGLTATRLQLEREDNAGQFEILLVEEKKLAA